MNPIINLNLGDCLPAMKEMDDNTYDLAIVDPPYGLGNFNRVLTGIDIRNGRKYAGTQKKYGTIKWNNDIPPEEYFIELKRVSKNHIIFGFQYFKKYLWDELQGVIIHDFKSNMTTQSMADLAITNLQRKTTVFRYLWDGFKKDNMEVHDRNRIHSCEKPVSLYKWLLKRYAKEGWKILDTHGGSMSIAIACWDMGYDLDLWENDEVMYNKAVSRFNIHTSQKSLFRD